jgi:hypothetical protein
MTPLRHIRLRLTGMILAIILPVAAGHGQEGGESQDARVSALQERVRSLEESLVDAEKQVTALSESLATANGESRDYRERYETLRAQSEALGLAVLQGNGGVQERLLAALNDLRRLEEENQGLRKLVDAMYGAARRYMDNSVPADDTAVESMQKTLAAVEKHYQSEMAAPAMGAADLESARIIGIKQELGLVVLNVGRDKGVRPGMPLQIVRVDKPIVPALVVDVRDNLCGAVCQAPAEAFRQVRLGDGIRLEMTP